MGKRLLRIQVVGNKKGDIIPLFDESTNNFSNYNVTFNN